ncbi:hypothetical protein TcCL_Unassigned00575 [Trypanosoma cruzi]|nr:hypothetical protein TcCL_Unassigned00575 [Trypanosoma cruzi]
MCGPALTRCNTPHPTGKDRQAEREREMDAVKRHSRSTWPVSMRPLHAGTQEERMTGEKSKRQHKHTTETKDRREKHRQGPHPGRQLHTSPHTYTHHRSAASPRVGGFGPPQNEGKHRHQSTNNGRRKEATHRHRLQLNPIANGIRPQPRSQQTQRIRSEQSPKEPHAEADHHPPMTRRLSPRSHTECIVSLIELMLRPSLKDASVRDGS